jgi:hypothetical protein
MLSRERVGQPEQGRSRLLLDDQLRAGVYRVTGPVRVPVPGADGTSLARVRGRGVSVAGGWGTWRFVDQHITPRSRRLFLW